MPPYGSGGSAANDETQSFPDDADIRNAFQMAGKLYSRVLWGPYGWLA